MSEPSALHFLPLHLPKDGVTSETQMCIQQLLSPAAILL